MTLPFFYDDQDNMTYSWENQVTAEEMEQMAVGRAGGTGSSTLTAQAMMQEAQENVDRQMRQFEDAMKRRIYPMYQMNHSTVAFSKPEFITIRSEDAPMGVSQWRNHGQKYGYWDHFKEEVRKELLAEIKPKNEPADKVNIPSFEFKDIGS